MTTEMMPIHNDTFHIYIPIHKNGQFRAFSPTIIFLGHRRKPENLE